MKLHSNLLVLLLLVLCPQAPARQWVSADGSRTFDGTLVGYSPPQVTVSKLNGDDITFDVAMLSPEDRYYCQVAGKILKEAFYDTPLKVLGFYEGGILCQGFGESFAYRESIFVWGESLHREFNEGQNFRAKLFRAGSCTVANGRERMEVRAFALSLDEAVAMARPMQPPPDFPPPPSSLPSAPPSGPAPPAGPAVAYGTGFAITHNGWLITNQHVVKDSSTVQVSIGGEDFPARIVFVDAANDLALLKTAAKTEPLSLGFAFPAGLGDEITVGGFPNPQVQGTSLKMTRGIISSMNGIQDDVRWYQIDAAVQPGNSGGPLLDDKGRVVGIVNARLNDAAVARQSGALPQNVNYAIKVSYLLPLLQQVEGLPSMVDESPTPEGERLGQILERATYLIKCEFEGG